MEVSLKILEKLLPDYYRGAWNFWDNGEAVKKMTSGTKTKNKAITSEV